MTKTRFVNQCSVPRATIVESLTPAGEFLAPHTHDHAGLYFVLQGQLRDKCEGQEFALEPAHLLYQPAGCVHSNQFPQCTRLLNISLEPAWFCQLQACLAMPERPVAIQSSQVTFLGRRLHQETHRSDAPAALAIEGLLLELLSELCRQSSTGACARPSDWLQQTRDLLHALFLQNPGLSEIAARVGVHPSHLARRFRQHYGCTLGEYARNLRLEHALRQLDSSNAPLAEIALEAGFSDQSHFTRAFTARMGVSPAAYRRLARSGKDNAKMQASYKTPDQRLR